MKETVVTLDVWILFMLMVCVLNIKSLSKIGGKNRMSRGRDKIYLTLVMLLLVNDFISNLVDAFLGLGHIASTLFEIVGVVLSVLLSINAVLSLILELRGQNKNDGIKHYEFYYRLYLILMFCSGVISTVLRIVIAKYSFSGIIAAIPFILFYYFYLHELYLKQIDKEKRISELQNSITFSQIRPHFLYNCLNTIYYLCEANPKKAQTAIADFSDYLRGDLDSLSGDRMVSFEKELEHTKRYLKLEKMRFEDELQVNYDIKFPDFMIPTLTLQPLVENAVKHGISKKVGGGLVTISTYCENENVVIRVSDDGVGFDMNAMDFSEKKKRTHIGISNVKNRISNMCGGTMEIYSAKDVGTIITLRLPLDKE